MSRFNASRFVRLLPTLALGMTLAGCGGGVAVTSRSLAEARRAWDRANIADYDIEWTSTGPSHSHYAVEVRDRQVRTVASITPDGRRFPLKPAEPRFYGVDGLFLVIADELAQLDQPTPFGRPKGTRTVLKFSLDPKYGYPRAYRRDVVGAPSSLAIDVVRFEPVAGAG